MNELPGWMQALILFGVPAAVLTAWLFLLCMVVGLFKVWREWRE